MTRLPRALVLLTFLLMPFLAFPQNQPSHLISGSYTDKPLTSFLEEVSASNGLRFFYQPEWLVDLTITGQFDQDSISRVLRKRMETTGLKIRQYDERSFVFLTRDTYTPPSKQSQKAPEVIVIGDSTAGFKGPFLLEGTLTDVDKNVAVVGVRVAVEELRTGSISNAYGQYSLKLPPGLHIISFSYPNFETERREVFLYGSGKLNVEMFETFFKLDEVTIEGEQADRNVSSLDMGVSRIDLELANKLPSFLGEVDVVRSVLLLPGVTSVGEGATGYNVRGGTVDQNLILLDGAPIFNPSHVFGLFSNFNPDAIADVTLYRGGVPARFGGRAASVMDVTQREGAFDKWHLQGGLGLVASRLAIDGPLIKDKTSIMLSGRLSYGDWILGILPEETFGEASARFYDASGKLTHKFGNGDKLTASFYRSQDAFKLDQDTVYRPQNTAASIRYGHLFGEKLFGSLTASVGDYTYQVEGQDSLQAFQLDFGIRQYEVNANLSYPTGAHKFQGGLTGIRYEVKPGELRPIGNLSNINPRSIAQEQGMEFALFLQDEWQVNQQLSFLLGLRFPFYFHLGPGEVRTYDENFPRRENNATDVELFESGVMQQYQGIEPRISMRYLIDESTAIKASAQRMRQNLHLISNTQAITPLDVWKLSDRYLRPQISDQISVGYFKNFLTNSYETSVELYYKRLTDLIEYKDGANLLLNPLLETVLINGNGQAYGAEFLVQKKTGRVTGWASYTYSRTLRKVESAFAEETINDGKWYPSNFDKPHDLTIAMNYQMTRRYGVSANFTYSTGRPFTGPDAKFIIDGIVVASYADRNQFRMPDYHRLDLSLTFGESLRKDKKYSANWAITIYNLYGRRNPYSIFFKDTQFGSPQALRLSVLGAPFPAVVCNIKF
jgi:hypothetical protein